MTSRTEITATITEDKVEILGRTDERYLTDELVRRLKVMFDRERIVEYYKKNFLLRRGEKIVFHVGCNSPSSSDNWANVQIGDSLPEIEGDTDDGLETDLRAGYLDVSPDDSPVAPEVVVLGNRSGRVMFKLVF